MFRQYNNKYEDFIYNKFTFNMNKCNMTYYGLYL